MVFGKKGLPFFKLFNCLPPMSLTPMANLPIATGIFDTGSKFAAGIVDSPFTYKSLGVKLSFSRVAQIGLIKNHHVAQKVHNSNYSQYVSILSCIRGMTFYCHGGLISCYCRTEN
jgi:hypothetical protein